MVARHAFGSKVIVASRAREACKRGNRSVIKLNGWKKRTRAVAGTATHAGWNMVRRFAAHMETIVATLASAFLDHDMTEHQPRKAGRSRCMTTVTGSANRYVLDRSGQSASRIVLNVAGSTLSGCSLENLIQMASLAAHSLVRAPEFKTGGRVVECDARLLRMHRANGISQQQQNRHHDPTAQHARKRAQSPQTGETGNQSRR